MVATALFCPIRKEWIKANPEEQVRQKLIQVMTVHLGYPASLIAVEKNLHHLLPHSVADKTTFPRRRSDLICYSRDVHPNYPLYPLLLIECKAIPLTSLAFQQVAGYNHYLKAPFIALANLTEIKVGWRKNEGYTFIDKLPSYKALIEGLSSSATP